VGRGPAFYALPSGSFELVPLLGERWKTLFTSPPAKLYCAPVADVAELADALDSKSGIREDVWVRPPPSAPSSDVLQIGR
jgi:hypothetical protein